MRFGNDRLTCKTPRCHRTRPSWAQNCSTHRTEEENAKAPKPTSARASKYSGHCQCCGSLQKLPNELLSLHGYTVDFGFFNGTCQGARELPYELSCDLIKKFIKTAREQLTVVEATQAQLRTPATEAKAWVHVYYSDRESRGGRSHYKWEHNEITVEEKPVRSGKDEWISRTYFHTSHRTVYNRETFKDDAVEKREKIEIYDYQIAQAGVLAVCSMLNAEHANSLEREVRNLKGYIKWQQRRVDEWKAAELLPVAKKDDKQGFQPEGDPYAR